MPLRTLAAEPQGASVLAEARGRGRVHAFGQVKSFSILLRAQCGKHTLRRKRTFVQPDADGIVNRIRDCWDGGGQGTFATFLRPEWSLGINAFDDDCLNFRGLYRGRTP